MITPEAVEPTVAPEPGTPLGMNDWEAIANAIDYRQRMVVGEDLATSVAVALANAGERFTRVACVQGCWEGLKGDVTNKSKLGLPLCPAGHPLMESTYGTVLGWVRRG